MKKILLLSLLFSLLISVNTNAQQDDQLPGANMDQIEQELTKALSEIQHLFGGGNMRIDTAIIKGFNLPMEDLGNMFNQLDPSNNPMMGDIMRMMGDIMRMMEEQITMLSQQDFSQMEDFFGDFQKQFENLPEMIKPDRKNGETPQPSKKKKKKRKSATL